MSVFDYIAIPFGWIISLLYSLTNNYPAAILIFAALVSAALYPITLKNTINANKKNHLQPYVLKIRAKYPGNLDMQNKMMELMYQDHRVNLAGGCLLAIFPFFILITLFSVVSNPLYHIFHMDAETVSAVTARLYELNPDLFANARGYNQIVVAQHLCEYAEVFRVEFPNIPAIAYEGLNCNLFGINTALVPPINFTNVEGWGWAQYSLLILPGATLLVQSMPAVVKYIKDTIGMLRNKNYKKMTSPMGIAKPLMLLLGIVITFFVPGVLCVYWMGRTLCGYALNIITRKKLREMKPIVVDMEELAVRSELAIASAAEDESKTKEKASRSRKKKAAPERQDERGCTEYAE